MKCQSLFSWKNVICLSSAELAQRDVKVKMNSEDNFLYILTKTYLTRIHWHSLDEAIPTSIDKNDATRAPHAGANARLQFLLEIYRACLIISNRTT